MERYSEERCLGVYFNYQIMRETAEYADYFWFQPEDRLLFERMRTEYVSENEKYFFEEMKRRTLGEEVNCDVLVLEHDNQEKLAFVRYYSCEYEVSRLYPSEIPGNRPYMHTIDYIIHLSGILQCNINRFEPDLAPKTLWEWLRETDYRYVRYDRIEEF